MKEIAVGIILAVAAVAACTSFISPKIDEQTGTTLAQRCVDYRASLASYELVRKDRELSEAEAAAYAVIKAFVVANCPPVE